MPTGAVIGVLSAALVLSMTLNCFLAGTVFFACVSPEYKDEIRKLLRRVTR